MSGLLVLVGSAVGLGGLALLGFFWSLKAGQYDDLQGAAQRILIDDDGDAGRG